MSKFYSLNKINIQKHSPINRSRVSFRLIAPKFFGGLILFLIIFTTLFYIISVNSIATKGFKIEELEKRVSQLKVENKKLELETTSLQSIGNAEEIVKKLGLVKVSSVEYLKTGEGVVAVR